MFSVVKSHECPTSLEGKKYNGRDVYEQLEKDFYGKCYICGGKARDREIEHFIPHEEKDDLLYGWTNLFLSCGYCNNRKSSSYNSDGKNILNCTKEHIEGYIQYQISPFKGSEPIFKKISDNGNVDNTIELLQKVFTQEGALTRKNKIKDSVYSKRQELENRSRCDEVIDEILKLQEDYHQYLEIKDDPSDSDYTSYRRRVSNHFNRKTPFYEFKVSFLETNSQMKENIKEILNDKCQKNIEHFKSKI